MNPPLCPEMCSSASPPSLVVPRQHESVLVVPCADDLPDLILANAQRLSSTDFDLDGISFQQLRDEAREAVIAEAVGYTSSLINDDIAVDRQSPLVVTGHQPELFHIGVWAKNFAAAGLSRQTRGLALNLVVDNDTLGSTRIRVPVSKGAMPSLESIPFDAAQLEQPWEEAAIADRACFEAFGEQVRTSIQQNWNYEPLIASGWPAAIRQSRMTSRLSDCLVAARVAVERAHGLQNLELPMSRVCSTRPFGVFAASVLRHLPRFHAIYNEAVRDYRQLHHLRSTTHPVPELIADSGWLEAPFWVWRAGCKRRERPVARQVGSEIHLRDSTGIFARLALTGDSAADVISQLGSQGIRFRTRALTTTMFARLFLADLFIHGIGGAKYDAMTDQICQRFFGIEAPRFATVTATAFLPLGAEFPHADYDLRGLQQRLRDTRYNPDRLLDAAEGSHVGGLIADKNRIINELKSHRPTKAEHRQLTDLNELMSAELTNVVTELQSERAQVRYQLKANSVLRDREFSWGLYPEETLIRFFSREFLPDAVL
ncbi:MAG: hypothetical protein JWP89_4659 [Schlesneria sp.]|nr:hypothetical protein [Schlesneria sp.]